MTPSLSPLSPQLVPRETTPREKAAIVVHLLLAEGGNLPLSALPDHLQSALTEQMGRMGLVDRATLAAHSDGNRIESELEEAWVETRSLPAGLQLRGGRMLAALGYLNEQHPHADDFVERPLMYRAFFGGHWNDDAPARDRRCRSRRGGRR